MARPKMLYNANLLYVYNYRSLMSWIKLLFDRSCSKNTSLISPDSQLLQRLSGYAIFKGNCYLMCLKGKKTHWVFEWDLLKGRQCFIQCWWSFWHCDFTTKEPWKLTRGFKACCGGDHVLWRCLDNTNQSLSLLLFPHTEMFSLLEHDLSDSFHATCSKGELIKGPFK